MSGRSTLQLSELGELPGPIPSAGKGHAPSLLVTQTRVTKDEAGQGGHSDPLFQKHSKTRPNIQSSERAYHRPLLF